VEAPPVDRVYTHKQKQRIRLMKLREIRIAQRITHAELAARANVSVATLSNVERGTHRPSVETMIAVAKALDMGLADIDEFAQRLVV
jgi:transcriptional regulator with XRE-family HTH domain